MCLLHSPTGPADGLYGRMCSRVHVKGAQDEGRLPTGPQTAWGVRCNTASPQRHVACADGITVVTTVSTHAGVHTSGGNGGSCCLAGFMGCHCTFLQGMMSSCVLGSFRSRLWSLDASAPCNGASAMTQKLSVVAVTALPVSRCCQSKLWRYAVPVSHIG